MDVPDELLDDLRVSSNAYRLWGHLKRWQDNEGTQHGIGLPQADLARIAGLGIAATKSALQQLEDAGWITVDRPPAGALFTAPRITPHNKPVTR